MEERNIFIKDKLSKGWPYRRIKEALWIRLRVNISRRQLQRVIVSIGHYRRARPERHTNIDDIIQFITDEVNTVGQSHGCRMMQIKCIKNGLYVSRDTVAEILRCLDPEGVELRRRNRLVRRNYYARGPNYNWHIDSYDKLKPYGLAINGCVDGFSRHIIWMNVSYTNNDPRVVAGYFINSVLKLGGSAKFIRVDPGTENANLITFQEYLVGGNSVHIGSSVFNTRIESMWCQLRKQMTEYFLQYFKSLVANGNFTGDNVDKDLARLCFMHVVQVSIADSGTKIIIHNP